MRRLPRLPLTRFSAHSRGLLILGLLLGLGCTATSSHDPSAPAAPLEVVEPEGPAASPATQWKPLFDGASLEGWVAIPFGGEGAVSVSDGSLQLEPGMPLTGVRFEGALWDLFPEGFEGYELHLEARRVRGSDFFCTVTFPVGHDGFVSLVCGGWGGALVGISNLDGEDASENSTTTYLRFKRGRWYSIDVKVSPEAIEVLIDGEALVHVRRADVDEFSLRPEVELTRPLGITTYNTHGEIRKIEVRALP